MNKGKKSQLNELVPEIVPKLPLDPFIGKDFVYRREEEGFIIYSLGENAEDDGGKLGELDKSGDFDIGWKFDE
ncbi:hypothetical protein H8E77_39340 [bacterium]|nr:hypothetical protein [bacterium]